VVAPGFVELQCNGAGGVDLTAEPERLWEVARLLPRWGVTSWLPTIVTSPDDTRRRALAVLRDGPTVDGPLAEPLGYHFEGPFLSPERKGAHAVQHMRLPEVAAVAGWTPEAGVALVTLAPELPGALDVLRALVDRGIVVSLGHSTATAAEATAAVDAGARWATHLFNAMPPLHHRDPGLAGVALTDDRLSVGVIADGLHMHPLMVDLASRALGDRLTLVTDAVAALGMPPGLIRLGDMEALADDEGVRLADGTLAGSNLSMDDAVGNLMAFAGVDLVDAVAAATVVPARLLGVDDERGVVGPGSRADLVLLAHDGTRVDVVATLIGGDVAYDRREPPWKS
jgi:N-acetylglucosamine-6-phosphate deacetylase